MAGKTLETHAFAHVDDERGAIDFGGLTDEVGEARDEVEREIVDRVVTEIFKGFERAGLAGAAHAGEDDELAVSGGFACWLAHGERLWFWRRAWWPPAFADFFALVLRGMHAS